MQKKDTELDDRWNSLMTKLELAFGKKPRDMNAVLYLIGIQELGQGLKNFSKEQKQDLMHIAICKVLSFSGYYELEGSDHDGWPHWKLIKKLPHFDLIEQEKVLKMHILEYFDHEIHL